MTASRGLSRAEFEAELDARGFEPTDKSTVRGRFWRKKGRHKRPYAHIQVPHAIDGYYPESVLWLVRQQIAAVNSWTRPRLVTDDC